MSDATPQENPAACRPTTASHPFDKVNADIILRTSDRVDFHVYSQILIAASPFFEGMFDVPQPPLDQQQLKYGRPIIDVSETSKALDPLLRICYPINKPKKRSLEEVELSLAAAMKFEMELPTMVLTEELYESANDFPLEVWGIACRLCLETVARCAGNAALCSQRDFTVLKDMKGIAAANYFRLREFVRLRGRVQPDFKFLTPVSLPNASETPASAITTLSFADAPPPDIICRAADGVEFRAHKAVLSVASAALREKVSLASSPAPEKGTSGEFVPAVIQFEEESTVLHATLQLSYHCPTDLPLPADLADLTAVLGTMEKYGLHSAQPTVWSVWQTMASASPLRAYCLAVRAGHTLAAREAAKLVLNQVVDGVYVEELEYTPALVYHRLLSYYEKCCAVRKHGLTKIGDLLKVSDAPPADDTREPGPEGHAPKKHLRKKSSRKGQARSVTPIDPTPTPPWLLRYVQDIPSPLQLPPGSILPGLPELLNQANKAGRGQDPDLGPWCEECQIVAEGILEVSKAFRQLSDELSKVELEI